MAARRLERGYGVVLACDYPKCKASIRGLVPGTAKDRRKKDVCPKHAVKERAAAAERAAKRDERRAKRSAKARERLAKEAQLP